jgi:hypothetical protein
MLRRYKRTETYKNKLKSLNEELINKIDEEKEKFIEIYKLTPKLLSEKDWINELSRIESDISNKQYFVEIKPTLEECREELLKEAIKKKIHSIFFWTNAHKREDYVNEKISAFFEGKTSQHELKKATFEKSESERNNELVATKNRILEKILPGDNQYISESIHNLLHTLSLPVDFSIDYQLSSENVLDIDIDLPEIEDLPDTKANLFKIRESLDKKQIKAGTKSGICNLCMWPCILFWGAILQHQSSNSTNHNFRIYSKDR